MFKSWILFHLIVAPFSPSPLDVTTWEVSNDGWHAQPDVYASCSTAPTCSDNEITYTVHMEDSIGDGWDGAAFTFTHTSDGSTTTGTLSDGAALALGCGLAECSGVGGGRKQTDAVVGAPPVLGFLAIGCILGPHGLGVFGDVEADVALGDFGILFLLFNEGLNLSPERLRKLGEFLRLGLAQFILTVAVFFFFSFYLGP